MTLPVSILSCVNPSNIKSLLESGSVALQAPYPAAKCDDKVHGRKHFVVRDEGSRLQIA